MAVALSLGQASGRTALAIAAFISRPASALSERALDRWLANVGGHDLRPMLNANGARTAVEAYLSEATGARSLEVDAQFLNRLRTRAELVTAMEIALSPIGRFNKLKAFVVGAICRDAVRGALLRSDREAFAALLGPEVQEFASRQAATFYPALAGLAPQVVPALRAADGAGFAAHPASAIASRVVQAALRKDAPLAASILAIRENGSPDLGAPIDLDPAQCAEVFRLWQREAR